MVHVVTCRKKKIKAGPKPSCPLCMKNTPPQTLATAPSHSHSPRPPPHHSPLPVSDPFPSLLQSPWRLLYLLRSSSPPSPPYSGRRTPPPLPPTMTRATGEAAASLWRAHGASVGTRAAYAPPPPLPTARGWRQRWRICRHVLSRRQEGMDQPPPLRQALGALGGTRAANLPPPLLVPLSDGRMTRPADRPPPLRRAHDTTGGTRAW